MSSILRLHRPLVVLDLETTGLDTQVDRIVEIACVKLALDGSRSRLAARVNPERPIPPQVTQIHGITDADVADAPTFAQLAPRLLAFLNDCDLSGYNLERFDLPLLSAEFARLNLTFPAASVALVDSLKIFLHNERRDLAAAVRFYCQTELAGAHSAAADAEAAADVLLGQLQRYPDMPTDAAGLQAYCRRPLNPDNIDAEGKLRWLDGRAVLNFGKYRNRSLEELVQADPAYLNWVTGGAFSPEVSELVRAALNGNLPKPGRVVGQ